MSSEITTKVIKQVEYYFGDNNLTRDKFLKAKVKENDGWVPLEVLITFNRLKAITTDTKAIVDALRQSESGLLEVSEDGTSIRRSPDKPVPELTVERMMDLKSRTCYVKGFPLDWTMNNLLEFFNEHTPTYDSVQARRGSLPERKFKGSVWVIFSDSTSAKDFINKGELKVDETTLIKMTKEDYFKMKNEERKKKSREARQAEQERLTKVTEEKIAASVKNEMVEQAVLRLDGIPPATTLNELKSAFTEKQLNVGWVDFKADDSEAWVRFKNQNEAVKALELLKGEIDEDQDQDDKSTDKSTDKQNQQENGASSKEEEEEKEEENSTEQKLTSAKIIINNHEIHAVVLSGQDETKYWENSIAQKVEARANRARQTRGRGRGGGPRNRQMKRGRSENVGDGVVSPTKIVKTDD